MITYTNTTCNGGQPYTITMEVSVIRALWSLVYYELGYGGMILEVNPTKVVVRTQVLAATDIVSFEGSEEEIEVLIKAVLYYEETRIRPTEVVDEVLKITKGNALLVAHGSKLIMGGVFGSGNKLKLVAAMAAGIEDEEAMKFLVNIDTRKGREEFEAVLGLLYEGNSLEDIKELA